MKIRDRRFWDNERMDMPPALCQFTERWADLMEIMLDERSVPLHEVVVEAAIRARDSIAIRHTTFKLTRQELHTTVRLLCDCWDKRYQPALNKWYNSLSLTSDKSHQAMLSNSLHPVPEDSKNQVWVPPSVAVS